MSQLLLSKISAVRTKRVGVALAQGLARAIYWFTVVLMIVAIIDWLSDLPQPWRVAILAANTAFALYIFTRDAFLPVLRGADDDTLALLVERMTPAFGSRLIAAVQFARAGGPTPGESVGLMRAMITQTEQFAATVDFRQVIAVDRLLRWITAAMVALALTAGLYAFGGETSQVLLHRAFLGNQPLPSKTQVEVLSGSFIAVLGERAEIKARAHGWHPKAGEADITYASGRRQTIPLARSAEDGGLYFGAVEAVQEPFDYRVRLYDGTSQTFHVSLETRPVVLAVSCVQTYPKYTGLGEVVRKPTDLALLAGSQLKIHVTANKSLGKVNSATAGNFAQMVAKEGTPAISAITLTPEGTDGKQLTAEIPLIENLAGFSVHLTDDHGLESKNSAFYAIDLVADRPPTIRITQPERREILVTTESTTTLAFEAEDDYGIAKMVLKYKVDEGSEQAIPLALEAGQRQIKGFYPWQISKLAPAAEKPSLEGSVIEYYIEVRDGNDISGPGIAASEHYSLRVVSKAEKQAELISRMSESFETIRDVSDKQEKAAADLGTLILEQPATTRPSR